MPYAQNWGISRNAFQSPLNDNEPSGFGPMERYKDKDSKTYEQNFPNTDVDTDPNSDKDIIEANNEVAAKADPTKMSGPELLKYTADLGKIKEEGGTFRDPVNPLEWINAKEFDQNMINNEDDYRNRYMNFLDHTEGDNIVAKVNTIMSQPKAVSDKISSYLPGASEELVERMKKIKGSNKDFLTGLRKTAGNAAKGNTNAFADLYGTDNLGLNKGTANFVQNEAANYLPLNVAAQTGIAIGGNLKAAAFNGSYHPSGRILPQDWSDNKNKNVQGAIEQASVYLPKLASSTPWGKRFNTANTIYQKAWKGNKIINTLTYGGGKGKNKEHMGNIKNIFSSVLNKPMPAGVSKPKLSGTFGATTALTGKIASWFASKFK